MITALDPRTPVLVGVGEVGDPTHAADFRASSPVELASAAARARCSTPMGARWTRQSM